MDILGYVLNLKYKYNNNRNTHSEYKITSYPKYESVIFFFSPVRILRYEGGNSLKFIIFFEIPTLVSKNLEVMMTLDSFLE